MDILAEQALQALSEDNLQIVLINPNPATIETDPRKNVRVYLEPMTLTFVKRVLRMEKPDALISAFGGKPALNLTRQLQKDGILDDMHISLLSLNNLTLQLQDNKKFHDFLAQNKLPVANQWVINDLDNIEETLKYAHYPLRVTKKELYRPDVHQSLKNISEVRQYFEKQQVQDHFNLDNYFLNEDLSNWEELIFDVIRDNNGNFCFFNSLGSLEPVKINAADSLLVSPILTRNNNQIQQLRNCVRKIADILNIHGAIVVHFAVKQDGEQFNYKILSVKPRLTKTTLLGYRSSIYSIGYITAKVAVGYNLNEIIDPQSGLNASIEPIKDACSVKLPYWSFIESGYNHYKLSNHPSSSGQALGIGRSFESAFMKAIQATTNFANNYHIFEAEVEKSKEEIIDDLQKMDESHLIVLFAAVAKGLDYKTLHKILHIHPVFLQKINHLTLLMRELREQDLDAHLLHKAKINGFSDKLIAHIAKVSEDEVEDLLLKNNIFPSYVQIDGTAGLETPKIDAVYSAYGVENEVKPIETPKKCLLLGLKPFQVSLTGEFDYMIYHVAKTLKEQSISPIIISNNPESISNSYDVCDRVYFESITLENILAVARKENIEYVMTQFSGKQINQYRPALLKHGLKILGQDNVKEVLEQDRTKQILNAGVNPVPALDTKDKQEVLDFANEHEFPLLIGGRSNKKKLKSAVVFDMPALNKYISENDLDEMMISKFIEGDKYEITVISDGENVTIPGIIEHFEQTGSHASDSIAVFSAQNLSSNKQRILREAAVNIASQMHLRGPINLHVLFSNDQLYVLQIKTYAGHNVAFLSKSLRQDIAAIATKVLLGATLEELGCANDVWPTNDLIHVKMPVFSYLGYRSDNTFDSKMKTSGSVIGQAQRLEVALYKGYEASNLIIPSYGTVFISVKDSEKSKAIDIAARFHKLGFSLLATEGTANILAEEGITTGIIEKIQEGSNSLLEKISQHKINMVINVTNLSDSASMDAIMIKDQALSTHIPVFSSLQSAEDVLTVLEMMAMTTQPL
ncbi:carbamoyl-phosphate synthase, large subunit [Lactobacillus hominis DSM 23910 = CRBIP 24.179]|nr:carbamoyl-phosphate synthase, large subunit [Lactobacillus hominis DSM 23910 = CRBIP 24.179]